MIHIACCSNEKLAPIFGVVVTSIGINVTYDDVMMYLLHNGLKDSTVKRLQKIADRYKVGLKFLEIDLEILKDCPVDDKIHYGNIMMYARLLLPSMLPNLDKVIYLDCDLVVCKDLKSLWETDVNDVAVAMVPDLWYQDKGTLSRLGINNYYLNSGVIVMNLDYWRKHDVQNRLLSYIVDLGNELIYNDQDALNAILQDERRQLPVKYNVTPYYFNRNLDNYPKEMHEEIREARINPIIFHFLGNIKPWSLGCYVPGKKLFMKYQKESGWRHFIIEKYVFKRIIYTLVPKIKKKAWENKTYIDNWEKFYSI